MEFGRVSFALRVYRVFLVAVFNKRIDNARTYRHQKERRFSLWLFISSVIGIVSIKIDEQILWIVIGYSGIFPHIRVLGLKGK
jgi:hypothetical protein